MKRWMLCAALALSYVGTAAGQPGGDDASYAVTPVHRLLAGDGSVVVRLETIRFEVEGPGRATERRRRIVTVLNAGGREQSTLVVPYDRLRRLRHLSGRLRDAGGDVIRKLKKGDQEDLSAISGYSLYEDTRVRVASLYHDRYPYTVEYEYEVAHEGLINWPAWYPQWHGEAVEYATYEIEAPAEMAVRHTVRGMDLKPRVTRGSRRQALRWEVRMLPAFEPEPFGPAASEQAASVHVAPSHFEIEGSRGEMTSWEAFGRWYYGLSDGRQALPPEVVREVRAQVEGVSEPRERVRRLYAYLQGRTRYVSVQLGLGGWQPFDARYVHERGYGDCKALTNYMLALLEAIGIEAYPALIRRGYGAPEVLADFPSNQFNHAVLVVPLDGDTLWLENTSQTIPFGHIGADNEDRYALLVKPQGSTLVRSPRSRAQDNRQLRTGRVHLMAEGHGTAEVHTRYTGNQQDRVRRALAQRPAREREQWLHEALSIPSFDVTRADFTSVDEGQSEIQLPVSLQLPRYAARTGDRLFFRPNLMTAWAEVPPEVPGRTQPVQYFSYAFQDVDSLVFELPDGFAVEATPAPVSISAPFGRYEAEAAVREDGTLAYRRALDITETRLPPASYDAFRDFLRQVAQADRAQVVLVRK